MVLVWYGMVWYGMAWYGMCVLMLTHARHVFDSHHADIDADVDPAMAELMGFSGFGGSSKTS